MFEGLTGCLVVAVLLAAIGLVAVAAAAWWVLTHVTIGWAA
jgi:hypothetical protein